MKTLGSSGLLSLFLMSSSVVLGEEVEIYIPGSEIDVSNEMENSTPLGRCLNTGLPEYCIGLQLEGDGTVLESFDETQITLETLIFTDTDVQVVEEDETPTDDSAPVTDASPTETGEKPVTKTAVGIEILFDYDSIKIRPDQNVKVAEVAGAFNDPVNQNNVFVIVGHTDAKGSDGYNCKLSRGRASAVITSLKMSAATVSLYGVGAGEFLLKVKDKPEDARNRRVSIIRLNDDELELVSTMRDMCSKYQ